MPAPRRHHRAERNYNPRTPVGSKDRDRRQDQGPSRKRSPWNYRPRGLSNRETFHGQTLPRIEAQVTRDKRKTGEPPDLPHQGLGKREWDQEETDPNGEPWSHQPSNLHGQTNRFHPCRGPGGREPAKGTVKKGNSPGDYDRTPEGDTEGVPRWETKRRRSTPAILDLDKFAPGKESYPPQPATGNEADGPEQPPNPYIKERPLLKVETAAEPGDQWLLDDYPPPLT